MHLEVLLVELVQQCGQDLESFLHDRETAVLIVSMVDTAVAIATYLRGERGEEGRKGGRREREKEGGGSMKRKKQGKEGGRSSDLLRRGGRSQRVTTL